jgi:hypothetical protein
MHSLFDRLPVDKLEPGPRLVLVFLRTPLGIVVNSLMTELLEEHIRHHVLGSRRKPTSDQTLAADEVIDMW